LSGSGSLTGPQDAFAARIDTVGGSFVYSTYLGGSGSEEGVAIAVDSNENAYITGNTNSANFPTQNAFQSTSGGSIEAFVAKIGEVPPLAVSPDNVTMAVGSSASSNISGGLPPYSGSSADSSIATVSVSGSTATITGVNAGSTTVTITDSIGSTATINATVSAAVPPLDVSQDNVTLAATTSTDINISGGETPYTATSDDTTVATASVSGSTLTIDGVAVGTATVTVTDNATDSTTVDVTVTEAPPLEIGGCAQGTLVSETVDTASFDEITLNLCQEPPSTLSGRLYISIEAPSTLPGLMFFRPQDDAIPPGGSFVVLVRDSSGFLPDAEDNFFRQGTLSAAAGDVTFIVGTEGLEGLSPVFKTWYLPQGLDLNEVNLQVIQSVTITFN
jgi:hypothetical protein